MNELAPIWMPHEGQIPIIKDLLFDFAIGVFVQCGRKFGKTELAIYLCYVIAILIPNAEVYYVGDEKDHAREICWINGRLPRFFTTFQKNENESEEVFNRRRLYGKKLQKKYILSTQDQSMTVKLRNGSFIQVEGAKNVEKADGLSPHFIVYDEYKSHDPRFDQGMRPNLKTRRGKIAIFGTPPSDVESNYCKTAKEFQTRSRHKYYKCPCYLNPHVYSGKDDTRLVEDRKLAEMKGELHIFLREYMAEIVPDTEHQVFPMFKWEGEKSHVVSYEILKAIVLDNRKEWSFHVHHDPATTSTFATLLVAINTLDKRIFAMDEIYESNQMETVTKKIYPRSVQKCKEILKDMDTWRQGYDHAAAWFAAEVASEYEVGLTPCNKDYKDKEANLSLIKEAMLFNRFFISERCKGTISELKTYSKDERGNFITADAPKNKVRDHNIDNLRYILNAEGYDFVPREFIPRPQERRGYSMSEDLEKFVGRSLCDGA
jgi:hypothetical protein